MERDRRRRPDERVNRRAIVEFVEDIPRFAQTREARETGAPCSRSPGGNRDAEGDDGVGRVDDRRPRPRRADVDPERAGHADPGDVKRYFSASQWVRSCSSCAVK
jgi:hypothetical protein